LVLSLADPGADLHVLARLSEQRDARNHQRGAAQPVDHVGRRRGAFGERLEVDHQTAGVDGRVGATSSTPCDVRVSHDDFGEFVDALHHGA